MKRLVLLLLCTLPILLFAQEHMEFRGIPIDGNVSDFVSKMKGIGYTLDEVDGDITIMNGKFTGKDASIYIISSPKTKIVCRVTVYFEKQTSWSSIKSLYENYKELLEQKYKVKPKAYEYFKKPYEEGDGYEMQAVRLDKCVFSSFYETPQGYIALSISKTERISIAYEDEINIEIRSKEKESNTLEEL
jgi:hypothetical protein